MLQTMTSLHWNRITIVHENNLYGQSGARKLIEKAKKVGVCVVTSYAIDVTDGVSAHQVSSAVDDMITNKTTGIVFFGDSSTGSRLFQFLSSQQVLEIPIVMVSEAFNMDMKTFQSAQLYTKAKGSLGVTPLYRQVTEFQDYWRSIFSDETVFNNQTATNPWLQEVFYEITGCTDKNCGFQTVSESVLDKYFSDQPLFVQYAILAAHGVAKVLNNARLLNCPHDDGVCEEFINRIKYGDFINKFKELTIDFEHDFMWGPQSLKDGTTFTMNQNGSIETIEGKPVYQVFNLQNEGDSFALVKVADFVDGAISVNKSLIRDYDTGNTERRWPYVRKAQCPVGVRCSGCIPISLLQEGHIFDEGDVYVIGTNPIFAASGTDGCGDIYTTNTYQIVEAMRFAVSQFNNGIYAGRFTNLKIGFIGLSSCNNGAVIQRKIYDVFSNGLQLGNGTRVYVNGKVLGFVGALGSSISIPIAETLSLLKYVQISYASTSPLLSDRTKYPYFMRVVTPDDKQTKGMVEIMKRLNVTYVQLVYSEGAYGEGGRDGLMAEAYQNGICVLPPIKVSETDLNSVYEQLRKHPEAHLVITFIRSHVVPKLIQQLSTQMTPGEFEFLGSEAWAKNPLVLENDQPQITYGSITVVLEMYQDAALRSHMVNLEVEPFSENPWVTLYIQEKRSCYLELSFDKRKTEMCDNGGGLGESSGFVLDTWATPAYISTLSLLLGANAHFTAECGQDATSLCEQYSRSTDDLVAAIQSVKLDLEGRGDLIHVFDANGNGNIGYRIYNIQKDADNPLALEYIEVGRYPLEGEPTLDTAKLKRRTTSVCPNQRACEGCTESSGSVVSSSSKESVDAGTISLGVLFGVSVIVIVVLGFIIFRMHKQRYTDKDIYLHPPGSGSTLDSGINISGGSTHTMPSGERLPPGNAPACGVGIQSGHFHEIDMNEEMDHNQAAI